MRRRIQEQRRKNGVRKRTIAIKSLTKNKLEAGWAELDDSLREPIADLVDDTDTDTVDDPVRDAAARAKRQAAARLKVIDRPKTVGDCFDVKQIHGTRPCPWVSCKFHLFLDVDPETGSMILNFPDLAPWEIAHTCALDVAAQGGVTLDEVGTIMNLTRERIRQIEIRALTRKIYPALQALGIGADDIVPVDK